MAQQGARTRIFGSPFNEEVFDGRIERIRETSPQRGGTEIHIDFWGLRPAKSQLVLDRGQPWEIVRGERVPLRLRFTHARWLQRSGIFAVSEALLADHPARRLFAVTHLRLAGRPTFYHLSTDGLFADDVLEIRARDCLLEARPGSPRATEELRRWARRPPLVGRLVPMPQSLHQRFGGDPITIHLGARRYRHRLFIGGLHHQTVQRPAQAEHVINLCGEPNPWHTVHGPHTRDRQMRKGEMGDGMTPAELLAEATWAAERLRDGERVLIHCYAGINRSSTLCCATLMVLEGLSPAAALARVREHHPEAVPDPYHWFTLRWLASSTPHDVHVGSPATSGVTPVLRDMAVLR